MNPNLSGELQGLVTTSSKTALGAQSTIPHTWLLKCATPQLCLRYMLWTSNLVLDRPGEQRHNDLVALDSRFDCRSEHRQLCAGIFVERDTTHGKNKKVSRRTPTPVTQPEVVQQFHNLRHDYFPGVIVS